MQHGKASTYTNHRCRCDLCKRAWADYHLERGRKHRKLRKDKGQCIECDKPATRGLRCALHARVASQASTIRQLKARLRDVW